jgi:hypothetical protein
VWQVIEPTVKISVGPIPRPNTAIFVMTRCQHCRRIVSLQLNSHGWHFLVSHCVPLRFRLAPVIQAVLYAAVPPSALITGRYIRHSCVYKLCRPWGGSCGEAHSLRAGRLPPFIRGSYPLFHVVGLSVFHAWWTVWLALRRLMFMTMSLAVRVM